jgi:hypothetical protein
MRLSRSFVLVSLVAAACGGANPAVITDADPEASFEGYRTFDLLPEGSGLEEDRLDVEQIEGFIEGAIEEALVEKGYRRVTDGSADFVIGYHLAVDGQLSVRRMNTGYQYGPGWGWSNWGIGPGPSLDPDPQPGRGGSHEYRQYYDEGWMVLDVVDRSSHSLVWRGAVHGEVDFNATPAERRHRLSRAVRQIFRDFPP